jgi:hypothetical protein
VEDAKAAMAIVSILGAAAGIYYASALNPLNNYFVFLAIFALIGVGVANIVLLVAYEIYRWLKLYYANAERVEAAQTV